MSMTENLISALKRHMKGKGITYKNAASALGLSEVSVKRLFSEKSFTLSRIEILCDLADTDLAELLTLSEQALQKKQSLTMKQEQSIVDNPKLLLVGVCIINRCSFDEILERYQFTEPELTGLFTKLDDLEIIELLPGNRYRLKIAPNFHWQTNGPIQRFFIQSLMGDFLSGEMCGAENNMNYVWGMLSKESAHELSQKIRRLVDDYVQLAAHEAKVPFNDKSSSSLLVVFKEDWEPKAFLEQCRVE